VDVNEILHPFVIPMIAHTAGMNHLKTTQDYLITSALRDPFALTIGGTNAVWN
jgi:hypothetical protein